MVPKKFTLSIIFVCLIGFLSGCAGFQHGYTLSQYKGRVLPADQGPGQKRLRIEKNYDNTLWGYLAENPGPDYIHVVSQYKVKLYYVDSNQVAVFSRPGMSSNSSVSIHEGIPKEIAQRFRQADRQQLVKHSKPSPESSESSTKDKPPSPDQSKDRLPKPTQSTEKEPTKSGTCFAVNNAGMILTAYHIVEDADKIRLKFPWMDEPALAEMAKTSETTDLVLLEIEKSTPHYLHLARSREVSLGEEVFTIGYPVTSILGTNAKFTNGTISSLSGPSDEATFYQVSVPVHSGNSGGPLVNQNGNVVGVVLAKAAAKPFLKATGNVPENVSWAIKSDYALPLLEDVGKETELASRDEVIEHVRQATCHIKIYQTVYNPRQEKIEESYEREGDMFTERHRSIINRRPAAVLSYGMRTETPIEDFEVQQGGAIEHFGSEGLMVVYDPVGTSPSDISNNMGEILGVFVKMRANGYTGDYLAAGMVGDSGDVEMMWGAKSSWIDAYLNDEITLERLAEEVLGTLSTYDS